MGMAKAKAGKQEISKSKSQKQGSPSFKKAHMKRFLKFYSQCRVSASAALTSSLFLSIITQEIVQSSVKQAIKESKKTIKPKHIANAIRADPDLKILFKDVVLKAGGYEKTVGVGNE